MELLKPYEMHEAPNKFFMLSAFGLIISVLLFIGGLLDLSWAVAFSLTFLVMLLGSLLAISPKE
ncbi:MAG: hypothetical protein PWP03_8 [Candidatus Woesearchaeota archaeon]|nr:hypothetical protein [Candidatus Woesearchaeota archaeon]MDN5327370.1 hypothetical protein [Candidatus Woesearchaeota archaeon]